MRKDIIRFHRWRIQRFRACEQCRQLCNCTLQFDWAEKWFFYIFNVAAISFIYFDCIMCSLAPPHVSYSCGPMNFQSFFFFFFIQHTQTHSRTEAFSFIIFHRFSFSRFPSPARFQPKQCVVNLTSTENTCSRASRTFLCGCRRGKARENGCTWINWREWMNEWMNSLNGWANERTNEHKRKWKSIFSVHS